MGNCAACKKYTQKEKNQFILLTRSHFSLIAKNCVGLGTHTLLLTYYVIIDGTRQTQIIVTGPVFIIFVSFIPVV